MRAFNCSRKIGKLDFNLVASISIPNAKTKKLTLTGPGLVVNLEQNTYICKLLMVTC